MHPKVIKIVQHPAMNFIVGLSLIITGYFDLLDEERGLHAGHGAVLLGIFHVFKFGSELMVSSDLLLEGAGEVHFIPRALRRFNENYMFHFVIAMSLVAVGLVEAAEQFETEFSHSRHVWHYGLICAGMMHGTNAASNFADAIAFSSAAGDESRKSWLIRLTDRLHFPKIELFLGLFVVFVSTWEEIIDATPITHIGAHHGMLLFALTSIAKVTASMAVTIDMVNDVQRHKNRRQ